MLENQDKKLGLGIIAFEGTELIAQIVTEIKDLVDYIVVGFQKQSYSGQPCDPNDEKELQVLLEEGLVDKILYIETDKHDFPRVQETQKRNALVDDMASNGCTHELIIDSDEFYSHNSFKRAKEKIYNEDIEMSYCRYVNYFRDYRHYLVYPFENGQYVPFIAKIKYKFAWKCKDFPLPSDPTRRFVIPKRPVINQKTHQPEFVNITDGKTSDNKAAFDIDISPFSIVVADRGYCDYALLNHWDSNNVFFVVRHKDNIRYTCIEERPLPEKRAQNILIDEVIEFELPSAKAKYPGRLRRIAVWNEEHGYVVELLTNNFSLAASTIAALYMARWMIELFFRSLKQLLRIKSFIGTTRNAVEIQIWTALTTMLLLCWLKHIAKYKWALANLVVSLRLNTFTKIDLFKWLDEPFTPPPDDVLLA